MFELNFDMLNYDSLLNLLGMLLYLSDLNSLKAF